MRPGHAFIVAGACWLAMAAAALAGTVYRWVDEQGKVNYSDVVPQRFLGSATPVAAEAGAPTAEQQRAALERARIDQARAEAAASAAAASAPPPRPRRATFAAPASAPAARRPAQLPNEQTDCDTWQRLFIESSDCFGPYRTTRGATKPEAFEACNVVSEPPPRCRPQVP